MSEKIKRSLEKISAFLMSIGIIFNQFLPVGYVFATSQYTISFSAQAGHSMQIDAGHLKIDNQYVDLKNGDTTIGTASCSSTTSCQIAVSDGTAGKLVYNTNAFTLYNTNGHTAYNMTDTYTTSQVFFVEDYADPNQNNNQGGGQGGPQQIPGGTLTTGSFTYTNTTTDGADPADIWLNNTEIGVGQSPDGDHEYYKSANGTETFKFATFVNNRIKSININGTDYTSQLPTTKAGWLEKNENQTDAIYIEVPYAAAYNITTTTTRDFEWSIGNFLWSNDCDPRDDNYINHGKIEFVSLTYNNQTYNSLSALAQANKAYLYFDELEQGDTDGAAVLPAGSVLTVKLLPDKGYQLTSFTCNGQAFQTQNQIGTYTFTVPGGNFHWGAKFTKVEDVVKSNTTAIQNGSIKLGNESSMAIGTAKLEVGDATDVSPMQEENFKDATKGYNLGDVLDIKLYNTVYKASANSSWDTQVSDLDEKATITVKLSKKLDGNAAVVAHEKHDGTIELLDAEYDEENLTLTFETEGFSNYAIASKTVKTSKNPNTSDDIILYVSLLISSLISLVYIKRTKEN